eukprot:CAMPEP_0183353668 /NCGR_PEP_ID=MMETSP0164_2-20130417/34432_1 /TAXON_ID=221442 /ORGANISM="Coccolithus pelagicus ssp braarudi, Strain PLY182g" /LENGTH=180 /DNA_ID=CAMNT_0025526385 /DNA_START=18 /DNA_END=560 /DNA_ORIENTATION=+
MLRAATTRLRSALVQHAPRLTLPLPPSPLVPRMLATPPASQPYRLMCSHVIDHFLDPYEVDPKLPPPGRRWRASEIRLKSNEDLQKLWIVLLKERNMLASTKMLHRARKSRMPHEDRIRKVKTSMAMIRTVLAERESERQMQKQSASEEITADSASEQPMALPSEDLGSSANSTSSEQRS